MQIGDNLSFNYIWKGNRETCKSVESGNFNNLKLDMPREIQQDIFQIHQTDKQIEVELYASFDSFVLNPT